MDEITTSNYQQFKRALDFGIKREAEGFVKIGYLLRYARENKELFIGSGYLDINEMALKEYGLDASQVSRFISINERFSEGGYSDRLETHYEGFGVAKLALMLQLPDNLNEQLTPEFTKSEINTLREEVKEEAKVTDIEVMMEVQAADEIDEAIKETLREPDLYRKAKKLTEEGKGSEEYLKALKEILAPSGVSIKAVRVSGTGRIMVKFDETNDVKFVKVRQNETVTRSLTYVGVVYSELARKDYKELFGEDIPKEPKEESETPCTDILMQRLAEGKTKIAPVQPKGIKPPQKKESKVTPAPIPKVKPEEVEELPPKEPEKPDSYSVEKKYEFSAEWWRNDIAEHIERLYKDVDEIKKDYSSVLLISRVKLLVSKIEKLQEAETEEANVESD